MYLIDSGEEEMIVAAGFGEAALQVIDLWRRRVAARTAGQEGQDTYRVYAGRAPELVLELSVGMSLDAVCAQLAVVFAHGKACILEQYPPYGDVVVRIAAGVDPLDAVYALDSAPFVQWWNRNEGALGALHITAVEILRVEYWGLEPGVANVREIDVLVSAPHLSHPWRASLGNDSVAAYLRAWCSGVPHVVAVVEPRIPISRARNIGLVAGMLDGGDPRSVAVRESLEEAGVVVDPDRLMRISPEGGIALSPGARSEHMHFFVYDFPLDVSEFEALNGRTLGLAFEGERTEVCLVPERDFLAYVGHVGSAYVASHCLQLHQAERRYAVQCAGTEGPSTFALPRDVALRQAARWHTLSSPSIPAGACIKVLYQDPKGVVHQVASFT